MGRSRIRKSSSLSSLVTVLLMLDLAGDNGNVPPVCLPVTFLMAAPCESLSESKKIHRNFHGLQIWVSRNWPWRMLVVTRELIKSIHHLETKENLQALKGSSVALIIGSVIGNTLYPLGFMNITVVNYIFELISGGQEAIP